MIELLKVLARFNDFNAKTTTPINRKRSLDRSELEFEVKKISNSKKETVFVEHINFINFTDFNRPQPIYINLVRDPVERAISWFFYVRSAYKNAIYFKKNPDAPIKSTEWYKKDFNKCVRTGDPECVYEQFAVDDFTGDHRRQSLFFCGHQEICVPFNSPVAIQIAKRNVEKYYAVVGSWEETNITLAVFEKFIPRYFHGASLMFELHYDKIRNQNKNTRKPKIYEDVREMLRKNFTEEYDFYYFCKQRLYKQYLSLKLK